MSTPCIIAKKCGLDLYECIYCHNDGMPEYMLDMLNTHYSTEDRVSRLIQLGDASSIHPKLYPDKSEEHNNDHRQKDVCVFYGRDLGREDHTAFEVCKECLYYGCVDYTYVYEDGVWTVISHNKTIF